MRFYSLVAATAVSAAWQLDSVPDVATLAAGILVSAPVAAIAWRTRAVTGNGAVAGLVCAVAIYCGTLLAGIAVLGTALIVTMASTRMGRARKRALHIDDHGRHGRGAANVLANCLVGALAAALSEYADGWRGELGTIVFLAAIAAGASDTVASEIGKAIGGPPRVIPTLRRVAPGTPGAVSSAGTVAGIAAATLIVSPAVVLWLITWERVPLIVASCTAAAFIESALATGLESRGLIDNDTLNLLNTAAAGALAGMGLLVL